MVRPVWRRAWAKLETRLSVEDARLAALKTNVDARLDDAVAIASGAASTAEATQTQLSTLDQAWRQHVPAFLNAAASVRAFGFALSEQKKALAETRVAHEAKLAAQAAKLAEATQAQAEVTQAQTAKLEGLLTEVQQVVTAAREDALRAVQDRLEFVRREILFETLHNAPRERQPAVEPRIASPEKLAAAGNALRLNLGCGHIPLDGYINVDQRDLPGVDIVAEAGVIPIQPGTVHEVFSSHLLEHFPQETLRRRLLPYWHSLLVPGGTFRAIVPDGEAMLAGAGAGEYPFDEFREVLFGAQDYEGDFHFNLFTPDSLAALLREARFEDVNIATRGRRNGKCFEFEVTATRGS